MHTFQSNWHYPTEIYFGINEADRLHAHCQTLGLNRPLIVTDPGFAQLPVFLNLQTQLQKTMGKHCVFSAIKPNPVLQNITDGVAAFHANHCDGVIAIGGGSALDSGKVIALMTGQTRPLWDFEDIGDNFQRVDPAGIAPTIAVPTTAGTGSEVGRAAIIIDETRQQKCFIFHPQLIPNVVVADPKLTCSLPPTLTAATGMDALAHNLEAYCAKGFHPMADGIALEGIRLIKTWLPIAVQDGNHLEARAQLMAASMMGGTAFQKGLGAVHALSHPVGAIYDAHHGLLNAIFMPYVVDFNRNVIPERLQRLAQYLQLPQQTGKAVVDWLFDFNRMLGLPIDLSDIHVDPTNTDKIIEQALQDPSTQGNPKPLTAEDFKTLLTATMNATQLS